MILKDKNKVLFLSIYGIIVFFAMAAMFGAHYVSKSYTKIHNEIGPKVLAIGSMDAAINRMMLEGLSQALLRVKEVRIEKHDSAHSENVVRSGFKSDDIKFEVNFWKFDRLIKSSYEAENLYRLRDLKNRLIKTMEPFYSQEDTFTLKDFISLRNQFEEFEREAAQLIDELEGASLYHLQRGEIEVIFAERAMYVVGAMALILTGLLILSLYEYAAKNLKQIQRQKAALIASRDRALETTKTKTRFLANMSHEIRTPMNGVIGMTNLLLATTKDPVQTERLRIIQNSGNTLLDLLNDLLDFSKLEADRVELEAEPFQLHETVREVVELLGAKAVEKGLRLNYEQSADVPAWVVGDVTRFRQVLTNLVSNAVKFTLKGKVEISARAFPHDGNWKIEFKIADTGIGVPEELKDRLFQSFSQIDASTTRRFGGSGLGLAISKGLCERMGGNIWVESQVGQGSTFYFTFTAGEAKNRFIEKKERALPAADLSMGNHFPLRILVVDDNRVNQLVALGFLSRIGYEADVAGNGIEALECMSQHRYDIVFMDCHMPDMDGFAATEKIIELYGKNRPKIVALSASTMKADIDRCRESGMDAFVAKPVSLIELTKTIHDILHLDSSTSNVYQKESENPKASTEPFDRRRFLATFDGMEELAGEVVHSFLEGLPKIMSNLEEAVLNNDSRALKEHAHLLKGSLASFYAGPTQELAAKLYDLGSSRTTEGANEILGLLKINLEILKFSLKKAS